MFTESLSSAVERLPPMFHHLPCALKLLAAHFLHSSNAGAVGRLGGFVLLSQLNLYWAHAVILFDGPNFKTLQEVPVPRIFEQRGPFSRCIPVTRNLWN